MGNHATRIVVECSSKNLLTFSPLCHGGLSVKRMNLTNLRLRIWRKLRNESCVVTAYCRKTCLPFVESAPKTQVRLCERARCFHYWSASLPRPNLADVGVVDEDRFVLAYNCPPPSQVFQDSAGFFKNVRFSSSSASACRFLGFNLEKPHLCRSRTTCRSEYRTPALS